MRVVFGSLTPDLPEVDNSGCVTANNVIPRDNGYGPFPDAEVYSTALTARCQGAFAAKAADGTIANFAGDATKLYKLSATGGSGIWQDVSSAGGTYATATAAFWEFAQYGSNVLAVNGADNPQYYIVGSSTTFLSLSGSAPVAKHVGVWRDFCVMGNISSAQNRVKWSAIDNPFDWNVAPSTTQCDQQDLPEGGAVQRVLGGEFGVVFMERAIWRATYTGQPNIIFQFDQVERSRGTPAPGSVAQYGNTFFYLSDDGLFAFNGQASVPIGAGKIDNYILGDIQSGLIERCSSVVDPINKLYILAYPGAGASTFPNKFAVFNIVTGEWATVDHSCEYIWNTISQGFTLEQLDNISSSLDALDTSLDDRIWQGGLRSLAGFDESHRMVTFTSSSSKTATLVTGETQLFPDMRAFVSAVRPLVTGTSATTITAGMGYRNRNIDSVSYGSLSSLNTHGICPQRVDGRFHRLKVQIAGGFTRAYGAEVFARPVGTR